jgi:hypothetical protein
MDIINSLGKRGEKFSPRNLCIAISILVLLFSGGCAISHCVNSSERYEKCVYEVLSMLVTSDFIPPGTQMDIRERYSKKFAVLIEDPQIDSMGDPAAHVPDVQAVLTLISEADSDTPIHTYDKLLEEALGFEYGDTSPYVRKMAVALFNTMPCDMESLQCAMTNAKDICAEGLQYAESYPPFEMGTPEYERYLDLYMAKYVERRIALIPAYCPFKNYFASLDQAEIKNLAELAEESIY